MKIILALLFSVTLLLSGCNTPQERSGISPIPFNSPPEENNTYNGSF